MTPIPLRAECCGEAVMTEYLFSTCRDCPVGSTAASLARVQKLEAQLTAARADAEALTDLLDWAQRWQAGRRENTRLKVITPESRQGNLMAQVILQAKAMNEELDLILANHAKLVSGKDVEE